MTSRMEEALRLLEEGNKCHANGNTEEAIEKYRRSIELYPTADAHTYLGWMLSFKGQVEEAIHHCKLAIKLDPDFGNPYNDIGVYLMQQGKFDEAEPWLRKATAAKRYVPRQYPHINLGRIHITRGRYGDAIQELRKALEHSPKDPAVIQIVRDLVSRLNGSLGNLPDEIKRMLT